MASRSIPTETRNQLESLLNKWGARWRLQRVVLWLPRIMMLTLAVGMLVAAIVAIFQLLPATRMLILVGIAMGACLVLVTGVIGLRRKDGHAAARQFDNLFDLQERLATALELLDGRIQTAPEIAQRQLDDTYEIAKRVDARKQLPLKVKWAEWIGVFVMLILFIVILGFATYATLAREGAISAETQAAISAAADTARDITEDLATDSGLTDEERSALLESSETSLDELQNPDANAEDSFVAMSDLEADLREQANAIQESVDASNESMQSALDALNGDGQPIENPGEQLSQNLSELSEALNSMSAEEQAALAEQLQQAAEETSAQNEALSESLAQAAQALQDGQQQSAQDAMTQASQQAQSNAQTNQSRSETADSLEQAAQQAQHSARDIADTDANENSGNQQQGEQGAQTDDEGQQQSDADGQQQTGSEGQQEAQDGQQANSEGEGQNPNANQTGEDGSPVQSEDEGSASAQSSNSEGEGQQPPESQSADAEQSGQGGGSGDGSSEQQTQQITGTGDSPESDGTSNDGGEEDFESVFAPSIDNVQASDTTVELETDDNDAPSIEGEFQANPDGESTVPYNQIFSSYADSANSALENGYVPLGVRDVVRDYFTSIEPTGNRSGDE